jgi:hypothetical protein
MKKIAPFILLLLVAGCGGKSCGGCGGGETPDKPDAAAPKPVAVEDCGEALKTCLTTVKNTVGNIATVNETRTHCLNLEARTFSITDADKAALEGFDQDKAKCAEDLKACEDIRSRAIVVFGDSVKALEGCNKDIVLTAPQPEAQDAGPDEPEADSSASE